MNGTDQDTGRLDQRVFAEVLLLASRMQRHYDARLPELTLKQWLTLLLLRNLGGDASSVAQIAEVSGTTHQNTTKMLALLARDGWVERTASPDDQRALRITVTGRAHAYFEEHEALGEHLLSGLVAGLSTEDLATTFHTLATMQANLGESA